MAKQYKYVGPAQHLHFDKEQGRHVKLKPGDKVELSDEEARAWADRFEIDRSLLGPDVNEGHAIRSTEPGVSTGVVPETPQEREELAEVERKAEEARAKVYEEDAKARASSSKSEDGGSGSKDDPEGGPKGEPGTGSQSGSGALRTGGKK